MKIRMLILTLALLLVGCASTGASRLNQFKGLDPLIVIEEFEVYDLVVQRQLACAEALEYVGEDEEYQYYLPCLKGSQIFFVKNEEVSTLFEVLDRQLLTLVQLFEHELVYRHPIEE